MSLSAFPSTAALQAFHCHVVQLPLPSTSHHPSLLPCSLFGYIPVTATPPPPPSPPLCALSGHPPCLFRWNRRGNESSESTVNPFLALGSSIIVCILLFFFDSHVCNYGNQEVRYPSACVKKKITLLHQKLNFSCFPPTYFSWNLSLMSEISV